MKRTLGLSCGLALAVLPAVSTWGIQFVDLTDSTVGANREIDGDVGGTAIFENFHTHPSGTGVYKPFLTLEREAKGGNPQNIEMAYNTDGHTALYMDQQRPEWNTTLKLSDLAIVEKGNINYYCFELDANEPGNSKSLLSIDNIRIYTSELDNTAAVGSDDSKLNDLGTLRWAMNDPLRKDAVPPAGTGELDRDNWVLLDSNLSDELKKSNGGSGYSDMIVYIPAADFAGVDPNDFVWFYNLNGVHMDADIDMAAEAGYEEWRACLSPNRVPDGGTTLALLGLGLLGLGVASRRFKV